jgi:ribosomal protein L19
MKVVTIDERGVETAVTLRHIVENPAVEDRFDTTPPGADSGWRVEITDWKK